MEFQSAPQTITTQLFMIHLSVVVWCSVYLFARQPKSHKDPPPRRYYTVSCATSFGMAAAAAAGQVFQSVRETESAGPQILGGWRWDSAVKIPSSKLIWQITVGFYYLFQFNF